MRGVFAYGVSSGVIFAAPVEVVGRLVFMRVMRAVVVSHLHGRAIQRVRIRWFFGP